MFADTGTYLSQAIHRYAGWDRPVFYSLFLLPLHGTLTLWPVVVVQASLTAWILWLVCRTILPDPSIVAFASGVAMLSASTWLPWIVGEVMPDLFTPLSVLVICLLSAVPERLSRCEQVVLAVLTTFMIASQQSSLPLACILIVVLGGPTIWSSIWPGKKAPPHEPRIVGASSAAVIPSPRQRSWYRGIDATPANPVLPTTSDEFLWSTDSPLYLAGGPKIASDDAGAIIHAALMSDPAGEARAALHNMLEQLQRFDSGDGLEPWPAQVSPWIQRDLPAAEHAAYAAARQQSGRLTVPRFLATTHQATALAGVVGSMLLLPIALRRRAPCARFLLAVLLTLPVSAAITGGLSAPHDRYQSRIMWLPPFIAVVSLMALLRPRE